MNKEKILAVVGPTASGKTSLSIELAKAHNGEIISADSMQIYKGMSIATAKPDIEEMQGIRHHLIDFLDPDETFSVSEYVKLANEAAEDIISRGKIPILCGGTGLYVRSFLENIQFSEEKNDPLLSEHLTERYKNEGGEKLLEETEKFYQREKGLTASAAIGYKELKPYLDGKLTLDEAVENLKRETRRYAKRQLTWFRRDEYIHWIEADKVDNVFEEAERIIRRYY